jgi:hypothetical protein
VELQGSKKEATPKHKGLRKIPLMKKETTPKCKRLRKRPPMKNRQPQNTGGQEKDLR